MSVGLRDVRDIVAGTLRDVDTIATSPAVMRELLGDLQNAERILAGKLRSQVLKHGTLDSRFTGAQALAMQGPVLQAIGYVQDRVRGRTTQQAEAAIKQGLSRTVTTMEGLEQRFTGIATPVRLKQAAEMSTAKANARGMWARTFPTSVDRYGTKMLSEFEEIVRAGFVAGSSMDDVIAAITGHGGPTGKVSMAAKITPAGVLRVREEDIPEGLFVRHKYWAERLVRTEMLKAYNGARQAGLEEMSGQFPDMKRKILATLDKRTAPDSLAVHGQIRGIKDPFVDGAGRVYLFPPARPNDRETVIPWRTEWEDSSENLSEWEKAAVGEDIDEETEKKLEAMLAGKPTKAKAKVTPMTKKSPPTLSEKVEAELRKTVHVAPNGSIDVDGTHIGTVFKQYDPDPDAPRWEAYHFGQGLPEGGRLRNPATASGRYATRQEGLDVVTARLNEGFAKAAQSITKWDKDAYYAAVAADDPVAARRMVRGLLHEQGVLPRDLLRNDYDDITVHPVSTMPDARADHGWSGKVRVRQDVWNQGKSQVAQDRSDHLGTMVHEELHGSTKFTSGAFYNSYGAVLEEVSVEMAARLTVSRALGIPMKEWGSYQGIIDAVATQLAGADTDAGAKFVDTAAVKKRIGQAGLDMRSRKGAGSAIGTKDDMLRTFTKHASSKPAQKRARERIKAKVTTIR